MLPIYNTVEDLLYWLCVHGGCIALIIDGLGVRHLHGEREIRDHSLLFLVMSYQSVLVGWLRGRTHF